MTDQMINDVVERRASLLSTQRFSHEDERFPHEDGIKLSPPPEDKYFLVRLLFFTLGFSGMVPVTFFLTATDYWMFKFRDVSQEDYDPRNKTYLQTNFASISSTLNSIPTALTTILASVFAYKIVLRTRLLFTMTALSIAYITFTIFVEVNTDSWQMGFFIIIMALAVTNTFFGTTLSVSVFALLARFPPRFIKIHTYGSTMSGVVSALLQIFCLAVGGSSTQVALIFFLCGTSILVFGVILIYISENLPLYRYYMEGNETDVSKPMPSLADLKEVFKRVWMIVLPLVFTVPVSGWSTTTITILISSEYEGAWGRKYFIPVITFLLKEVVNLLGRFLARPILTRKNAKWFFLLALVHAYGVNPLFPFCNAHPRNHLPILFPHDWQYILLTCISGLLSGYLITVFFLSMSNLAGDKTEQGFQLFQSVMLIMVCASSPLNQVWVNLL